MAIKGTTPPTNSQIDRRWLKSVIAASSEPLPSFPWMRAAKAEAGVKKPIEVITGGSHRPTTSLFRRSGSQAGLAAR